MSSTAILCSQPREFEYTGADFERLSTLIYQRAGIILGANKREMLYGRLARRLRKIGLTRFKDYIALLDRGNVVELEEFTNALTTNLTSFFREAHHFGILAGKVKAMYELHGPLSVWCAACSTGEEVYSIAMTIAHAFDSLKAPVRILASDVDTQVLAKAQAGVYAEESLGKLPSTFRERFFLNGPTADTMSVRPELKELVVFRKINLLDPIWPLRGPADVIFCRNVMIYFDRATQRNVLRKFIPLMRSSARLFTGHSETLFHAADLFTPLGKSTFEVSAGARPLTYRDPSSSRKATSFAACR